MAVIIQFEFNCRGYFFFLSLFKRDDVMLNLDFEGTSKNLYLT